MHETKPFCSVEVFSHRGLSGDASVDAPLLTETALLSLAARGIHGFDVDLSFSSDGQLLIAHPAAVRQQLGASVDVFSTSSASIFAKSGARHAPMTALRLLTLVQRHNLTVMLDLKGGISWPDHHASHLLHLARYILSAKIEDRVWLWVEDAGGVRNLRRGLRHAQSNATNQQFMRLVVVKPVRDLGLPSGTDGVTDCTNQVVRGDEKLFTMLGPSKKCTNARLLAPWAAARWGPSGSWSSSGSSSGGGGVGSRHGAPAGLGAGLMVWVVDAEDELPDLMAFGVRRVISNKPLMLREAVRRRCGMR